MPALTDATYFYITDQRGTDRTKQAPPQGATSSTTAAWRYTR